MIMRYPEKPADLSFDILHCTGRANPCAQRGRSERLARARRLLDDPAWPRPEDTALAAEGVAVRLRRERSGN